MSLETKVHSDIPSHLRLERIVVPEDLLNIPSLLASQETFPNKAHRVMETLAKAVQVDSAVLRETHGDSLVLHYQFAVGPVDLGSPPSEQIRPGQGVSGTAVKLGELQIVNDYASYPQATARGRARGIASSIALPIRVGPRTLGAVTLVSRKPNHFTQKRIRLSSAIVGGLGMLMEISRLERSLAVYEKEMAVVDEVASIITSTLNIDSVYEKFAEEMKKLVHFDRMAVCLIDDASKTSTCKYLYGRLEGGYIVDKPHPILGTQTEHVLRTGKFLVRADRNTEPIFEEDQIFGAYLLSSISLPLISKGSIIGTISLRSFLYDAYKEREQAILERLARQIAPAIVNRLAFEQIQASTNEANVLNEVARVVTKTLDIRQVYSRFADEAKKLVDFDRMAVNLVDRDRSNITLTYLHGPAVNRRFVGSKLPFEESQSKAVIETQFTELINSLDEHKHVEHAQEFLDQGLNSKILVPLILGNQTIGTLSLASCRKYAYGENDKAIVKQLANLITPAIENARLFQEMKVAERRTRLQGEIAKNMAEGVCVIRHANAELAFTNSVFNQMFGITGNVSEFGNWPAFRYKQELGREIWRSVLCLQLRKGEFSLNLRDRSKIRVHASASTFYHDGRDEVWVVVLRDITKLKRVEEALRSSEARARILAADAVRTYEEERQLTAIEIHDRVAQELADLSRKSELLNKLVEDKSPIKGLTLQIEDMVRNINRETRSTMRNLYPVELDELGFISLMESQLEVFGSDTECRVDTHIDCNVELPDDVEITLFRVLVEALRNIKKHANGANEVEVSLASRNTYVELRIADNGPGFDETEALKERRVGGLLGMRRRAEFVGGFFSVRSAPGQGAQVIVRIPV